MVKMQDAEITWNEAKAIYGIKEQSQTRAMNDVGTLESAMDLYKLENSDFQTESQGLYVFTMRLQVQAYKFEYHRKIFLGKYLILNSAE